MPKRIPLQRLSVVLMALVFLAATGLQAQTKYDTSRMVVLGGVLTETVYALGAGNRVVAVDASSLYPAEAMPKVKISYHRTLSPEGVVSLNPSIVLATDAAGPPAALEQIKAAGIPVVIVKAEETEAGAKHVIRETANIIGKTAQGEALIRKMESELAEADAMAKGRKPVRVVFLYARGPNTMMAGGKGSSGDWLISRAGARNAIQGFDGYKPLNSEAMVAAAPEVFLLPRRGLESLQAVDGLLQQPGVALTPAGKARKIVTIDDSMIMNFGPRLGETVQELIRLLYPDTAKAGD